MWTFSSIVSSRKSLKWEIMHNNSKKFEAEFQSCPLKTTFAAGISLNFIIRYFYFHTNEHELLCTLFTTTIQIQELKRAFSIEFFMVHNADDTFPD